MKRASDTGGMDHLSDALDCFRCYKDIDIESFLREKAFTYLKRGWCSIYLIVDEAAFDAGKIKVDAYFTLSHKSLNAAGLKTQAVSKILNLSILF